MAVPDGYRGNITLHKGLANSGVAVLSGIIGPNDRNNLSALLVNNGSDDFVVGPGKHFAQITFSRTNAVPESADEMGLADTDINAMTLRPRKSVTGSGANAIPIAPRRNAPLAVTPSSNAIPVIRLPSRNVNKNEKVHKDWSDWKLNPKVFKKLDRRWGPHTVDMFSSPNNGQLPRRFGYNGNDTTAAGIDAFKQDWTKENGWANPPLLIKHTKKLLIKSSRTR
jgi:hypothetical protein